MNQYRHVCTHFNAFLMMFPNMVMKFYNFDIFDKFVTFLTCRLHSPAAWKALTLCGYKLWVTVGCIIFWREKCQVLTPCGKYFFMHTHAKKAPQDLGVVMHTSSCSFDLLSSTSGMMYDCCLPCLFTDVQQSPSTKPRISCE